MIHIVKTKSLWTSLQTADQLQLPLKNANMAQKVQYIVVILI